MIRTNEDSHAGAASCSEKESEKRKMKHVLKTIVLVMLLAVMMTGVAAAETNLLTITSQPGNKRAAAGSTATFTVEATTSATSISYQWQFRKDANSSWAPSAQSGNKTATLSVAATAGLNGYQFRCVIQDNQGSVVNSNAATLYIIPKITTQPAGKTVYGSRKYYHPVSEEVTSLCRSAVDLQLI